MVWRHPLNNMDQPINPEFEQEARLVEQARAGSDRAFAALLARYQQPVFRLIFYLVGQEDESRALARIALKHALLHMPRVPGGHSIRPWLLRVASLVALDAIRERSESPQALIAALQLAPPPGAPRMVDADPLRRPSQPYPTVTGNLAAVPRTASSAPVPTTSGDPLATTAGTWDQVPLEIERELIRRLLGGLPEGDAELLALGVVGQVPTRDLAALAGTSQRSIRRRIARALILFQSRYQTIMQAALPGAATPGELAGGQESAPPPILVPQRRPTPDTRPVVARPLTEDEASQQAQQWLEKLSTQDAPAISLTPSQPLRAPDITVPPFVLNDISQADTIITGGPAPLPPMPTSLPPMPTSAPPPALPASAESADPHEIPGLLTSGTPAMPWSSLPSVAAAPDPTGDPTNSQIKARLLPRFGPPPEEVLAPDESGVFVRQAIGEVPPPPTESSDVTPQGVEGTLAASGDVADGEEADEAEPDEVAWFIWPPPTTIIRGDWLDEGPPEEPTPPVDPVELASTEGETELATSDEPILLEVIGVVEEQTHLPDEQPSAVDQLISEPEEQAVISAEEISVLEEATNLPDEAIIASDEPINFQDEAIGISIEAISATTETTPEPAPSPPVDRPIIPDAIERRIVEPATPKVAEPDSATVTAQAAQPVPPWAGLPQLPSLIRSGDTIVVHPQSRAEYVARHRPPLVDIADLAGLADVSWPGADASDVEEPIPGPAIPVVTLIRGQVPDLVARLDPVAERDVEADLGDLSAIVNAITAPVPEAPVEMVPDVIPDAQSMPLSTPTVAEPPRQLGSRTPTRPVPRLKRDIDEPPGLW